MFLYGTQAPIGSAIGTWPRLDGAPSPCKQDEKCYDARRRKLAHFVGMDFLFTAREYCQSVQTDSEGRKVLVNSSKSGALLAVKPVPDHVLEKPWFNRKLRRPREYLGIPKIDERVARLSHLVHVLTQYGFPSRAVAKSVYRLSITWWKTRFKDMCKHVKSITSKVIGEGLRTRNPGKSKKGLIPYPHFVGVKNHANGIYAPLWTHSLPYNRKGDITINSELGPRDTSV